MVVLDGIGKDIGLAFTVGLGVLLGTDHDGLGAVALVDDDSGALVLQALDEETVEQFGGCLHDRDGAAGGGDKPELLILPVLQQVFAEGIGADEDAQCLGLVAAGHHATIVVRYRSFLLSGCKGKKKTSKKQIILK